MFLKQNTKKLSIKKNELSAENEKLKAELEEIKFGAPNLISDGKKFFEAKEFSKAREKFQTLLEKHPDWSTLNAHVQQKNHNN